MKRIKLLGLKLGAYAVAYLNCNFDFVFVYTSFIENKFSELHPSLHIFFLSKYLCFGYTVAQIWHYLNFLQPLKKRLSNCNSALFSMFAQLSSKIASTALLMWFNYYR